MKKINKLKGFENVKDYYCITEFGFVYSTFNNSLLKNFISNTGYSRINLKTKNGKQSNYSIHRIVAVAFIGYKNKLEVNHIDENKQNNNVENLEWVTSSDNKKHSKSIYLESSKKQAKLTDEEVKEILSSSESQRILAKKYGVSQACVGYIKTGKTYLWVERV